MQHLGRTETKDSHFQLVNRVLRFDAAQMLELYWVSKRVDVFLHKYQFLLTERTKNIIPNERVVSRM